MALYGKAINSYIPPANEPAHPAQIPNSDGGYVFSLPELKMLERILIVGATINYYSPDLEKNAVMLVNETRDIFSKRFAEAIALLVDVNTSTETRNARAPKKSPSIMALAVAASLASTDKRRGLVKDALLSRKVVSTMRQMHEFLYVYCAVRGTGKKIKLAKWLRLAVGEWLNGMARPAQQLVKYRRSSFPHQVITNRDVLRLVHPAPKTPDHDAAFAYAAGKRWGKPEAKQAVDYLLEFDALRLAQSAKEVAKIVSSGQHTWEEVPNRWFTHADAGLIWRALIPHMGLTALLRNMRTFNKHGLLGGNERSMFRTIFQRLTPEALLKERVHPYNVYKAYIALKNDDARSLVTSALYRAMLDAYGVLPKFRQNVLLAMDSSGSMSYQDGVTGATCFQLGVFIASVFATQFTGDFNAYTYSQAAHRWAIRPGMEPLHMLDLVQTIPCSTNPSSVLQQAMSDKVEPDLVVFITDNEVNIGHNIYVAAERFRAQNPKAKFVTFGLVANRFAMFGENDWSLNIAGLDAGAFQVVEEFVRS